MSTAARVRLSLCMLFIAITFLFLFIRCIRLYRILAFVAPGYIECYNVRVRQGEIVNAYYESLLEKIREEMKLDHWTAALQLAEGELNMPYVPADVQPLLEEIRQDCRAAVMAPRIPGVQDLEKWIHGTPVQQEMAVSMLGGMNLRQYAPQVQTLLDSDLLDEFKGELIESLMEQKIDAPFHIEKDGLDIEFVPSAIIPAQEDPGLAGAMELFDHWFSAQDPGMTAFCTRLLRQEVLNSRPFDFAETDPLQLAKSVVRLVCEAMGDEGGYKAFVAANGLSDTGDILLNIEKRGANTI